MIYSGFGLLAPAIYGIVLFALWNISFYFTQDRNFFFNQIWLSLLSFAVAGICVWFFGRWLNRLNPFQAQEFVEGERRVVSKPRHTIYALEMEYWGLIFAGASVVFLLVNKLNLL